MKEMLVKNAKLQSFRSQFESLKMEENEDIATYFLRIDEVVDTMRGLWENIKDINIVQKVLRSLPVRFNSKLGFFRRKN